MADAWPTGVPGTLWTYHMLALESAPDVPMMGVEFATGFLVATAAGAVFLLFFARDRFMTQRRPAEEGASLVLAKLEARELGGGNALRKAYLIYATVLLAIYLALTFFGNLIFGLTNKLPVAGIEVDLTTIQFDQPTWPLAVAFGLAGLAPLLKPVQIAEDYLRERAYRAVGIPTRIQKTSRNIIATLDWGTARNVPAEVVPSDLSPDEEKRREERNRKRAALRGALLQRRQTLEEAIAGMWVRSGLGRLDRQDEFLSLAAQVEMLVFWARGGRGAWPGVEVAEPVLALERGLLEDAEKLLNGLHERIGEHEDKAATAEEPAKRAARRNEYLADTLKGLRQVRGELAAVVAVFVERDPVDEDLDEDHSEIRDDALDGLLLSSEPSPIAAGPEISLGVAIICLMPLYATFAWREWHPLFSPAAEPSAPLALLATAGLEAARQAAILWLPVMVAFSVRQYLIEDDRWIFRFSSGGDGIEYLRRRAAAVLVGAIVAFLGLVALAALWAFLQAVSQPRYRSLLFEGSNPFLLYYPTMFVIAVPMVWSALAGADARRRGATASTLAFGAAGAVLMLAVQTVHLGVWSGWTACTVEQHYMLLDLREDGCFADYGGLDFFVYPVLAFVTAVFFGNPEQRTRRQARHAADMSRRPGAGAKAAVAAAVALVVALVCLAWYGAAWAADRAAASPAVEQCAAPPRRAAGPGTPRAAGMPLVCPPPARDVSPPDPKTLLLTVAEAGPFRLAIVDPAPKGVVEPEDLASREQTSHAGQTLGPKRVKLGMRADAEPFSFRREGQSGGWLYAGYVADLCHEIFAGPWFQAEEVLVTAKNRFEMLSNGEVDVLCDPVTMRFSDPDRVGLYSPIIFASGVSYLRRLQRERGARAQIAFVEGSTGGKIARRACEVDLATIVLPKDRAHLSIICETNWTASQLTRWQNRTDRKEGDGIELTNAFRAAAALQQRWATTDVDDFRAGLKEPICDATGGQKKCGERRDRLLDFLDALASAVAWKADDSAHTKDDPVQALEKRLAELDLKLDAAVRKVLRDPRSSDDEKADVAGPLKQTASRELVTMFPGIEPEELANLLRRRELWKALATSGGEDPCGSSACADGIAHKLVKLGYDQDCKLLDSAEGPWNERIFYRFCPMESHDDAISWLCSPRFNSQTNLIYMGDRDIIVGKLHTWTRQHGACAVENPEGADSLTYEPYALLFRNDPMLARTIQRGVYDFFTRRTHAKEAFEAYFPGKTMSVALSYLFLLNAVEEEESYTNRSDSDVIPVLVPEEP